MPLSQNIYSYQPIPTPPPSVFFGTEPNSSSSTPLRRQPISEGSTEGAFFIQKGQYSFQNSVAQIFESLKKQWLEETENISSISQIVLNDSYQRIIGLGSAALPLILKDLQRELNIWFPALRAITGADPVDKSDRGSMEAMRGSWLNWARIHGYFKSK